MILIADSGSSKTAWKLIDNNGIINSATTEGLNPLHTSSEVFTLTLQESEIADWPLTDITHVCFYSAGIVNESQKNIVSERLRSFFGNVGIEVASDLLGAARAGFSKEEGVIGILGTGSNSGFYDGMKIVSSIAPLGYILGDEGSGTALGKAFLSQFLRNQLPETINGRFKKCYPEYSELLTTIYTTKGAAKILASVVPFLLDHKDDSAILNILQSEFKRYILLLKKYGSGLPVILVGSVAYYFKKEIIKFAQEEGVIIEKIIQSPIEPLTQYHIDKLA